MDSQAADAHEMIMAGRIARRDALRQLAVFSFSALAPSSLIACSKRLSCTDTTGLGPEELNQRINIAVYVEPSPDPGKKCARCTYYEPAAPKACGGCKVVKGPISPEGTCKLFVAKTG